jgi:endonuclease/exonuclease/phosphatase family metal-dependent hydrolase
MLRKPFGSKARRPAGPLFVEPLEDRCVPSTTPVTVGVAQGSPVPSTPAAPTTLMSYNLYQGSELDAIAAAHSLADVPAAVSKIWRNVQHTNFPERAQTLAREMAQARPELIALQEASLWQIQMPGKVVNGHSTTVTKTLDFIKILQQDLAARGLHYKVVAEQDGFTGRLPDAAGDLVTLTDRVAILARTDLPTSVFQVTASHGAQFVAHTTVPIGGAGGIQFPFVNAWASVDVKDHGNTFRFVTFHLEPNDKAVNVAQANELLAGPGQTNLPLVFMGDSNSPADGSWSLTYSDLVHAGFSDAWLQTHHHGEPGFTSNQDQDLKNRKSKLSERIDLALLKGDLKATAMDLVGNKPSDKTHSGLWPSDHAGIVVHLIIHPHQDHGH